jgi:hypothetical protein
VDSRSVVGQISQLVSANEELQRENRELAADNVRLKAQLREIGDALGRLSGAPRRGRGGRAAIELAAPPVRRPRRPITDPVVLEKKKLALAKARAARAEKLAAARAAEAAGSGT